MPFIARCCLLVLGCLSLLRPVAHAQELPRRPFVGIDLSALPDSLQRRYHLPNRNGILVRGVRAQSSAQAAGLQAGDIVLQIDNTVLGPEVGAFVGLLKQYRVGDKATFTVLRKGRAIRKPVTFMPFPREQSPLYEARYAAVSFGPNRLRTIITRPRRPAAGKVPMVLFIQGVGCFSIDNPLSPDEPSRRIVDSLSRHGYATLRVDKTGMGDSQGTPCLESDFRSEAGGYKAALAAIRQLDFVDQQNVFVAGFSIGGIMAPLVAQGENLRGVVVFGTASRGFIEYALPNKRRQSELRGLPPDSIDRQQKIFGAALHLLLTEKQTPAQVLARLPAAKGVLSFPQHHTYMQQWQDANLAAAWQRLNAPVLALRGESDYFSFDEDHQLIADIVNRVHPGRATFLRLPDVDHHFNRARSLRESMEMDEQDDPPKNYEFMSVMLRWLAEQRHV